MKPRSLVHDGQNASVPGTGQTESESKGLRKLLRATFDYVYPAGDFAGHIAPYILPVDIAKRKRRIYLGSEPHQIVAANALGNSTENYNNTYAHSLSRITSFLNLPNTLPLNAEGEKTNHQSWLNILHNMMGWKNGWEKDVKDWKKAINIIQVPFVFTWYVARAILKLPVTILKLVTELLPMFLYQFFMNAAIKNLKKLRESSGISVLGYGILLALSATGRVITGALHFAGQAITSPIRSVYSAWHLGHDIANRLKNPTAAKAVGHVLGGLFTLVSMAITIAVYTIVFPLALKAIGSFVAAKAPEVVANAIPSVFSWISNTIITPVFGNLFAAMGLTAAPAVASVGAVVGAGLCTVGVAADAGARKINKEWKTAGKKSQKVVANAPAAIEAHDVEPTVTSLATTAKTHIHFGRREKVTNLEVIPQDEAGVSRPQAAAAASAAPTVRPLPRVSSQGSSNPTKFGNSVKKSGSSPSPSGSSNTLSKSPK